MLFDDHRLKFLYQGQSKILRVFLKIQKIYKEKINVEGRTFTERKQRKEVKLSRQKVGKTMEREEIETLSFFFYFFSSFLFFPSLLGRTRDSLSCPFPWNRGHNRRGYDQRYSRSWWHSQSSHNQWPTVLASAQKIHKVSQKNRGIGCLVF